MTATESPTIGAVVALTDIESAPRLLVTAVDNDETVTGVLLADVTEETLQRLASTSDRHRREKLALAVKQTELARFCVPVEECRQLDESGLDGTARRERESR